MTASDLATDIATRCNHATINAAGTEWSARCPAHDDQQASLSIGWDDVKVLVKCHAGCATPDIVHTLGMHMSDLFCNGTQRTSGGKTIVAIYPYYDLAGQVVHETVRYQPKTFKQRRPDPAHPGQYIWSLKGIQPILYRLSSVITAIGQGQIVYVVEGEKDADALVALGLPATCNPMGAGKWQGAYSAIFHQARVVILPDNDPQGEAHATAVATSLQGIADGVKVLMLPGLPVKGDVSDWLTAGGTRDQLEALVAAAPLWTSVHTPGGTSTPPTSRPCIELSTDIQGVTDKGESALLALPDAPIVYQRARQLCVIARGVPLPKWLRRPQDMPIILEASPAHLTELASQAADWVKWDKRAEEWVATFPPAWFILTLQGRPSWEFPLLEGIINSPTLRPDGSILNTPGYDKDTGLYLDTAGATFPEIPLHPDLDDARSAIGRLQEAVMDFPFAAPHHLSAAFAAICSIACRFAIRGNVPLFAIRATTRGSGKGLLADVLSMIGSGRAAPRWPQVEDPEEERKRLLTVALAGYPTIHIDNVVRPLGSPALDLALTSSSFSDRILGKTESREAPLHMVWLASGNNMQFWGDTARRVIPIDLDPQMEKPEERDNFHHQPLVPWVQKERPVLTVAALTIVKAFFTAGCPAQGIKPLGSFEQWSDIIRQALIWAGEHDPCAGRQNIEAESDPQYERLATLLHAWDDCYANIATTLNIAIGDIGQRALALGPNTGPANKWNQLYDALSAFQHNAHGKTLNAISIAKAFKAILGRVIDVAGVPTRFVYAGKNRANQSQWKVETL